MELVRMGANLQCNSCFQDFYSLRDLFLGTEGSSCNNCNDNSRLRNSNHHDHSLYSLSSDHLSGHNKEILKQTMLKHEAIFRGQIEDLHRLYWKQKTLMEELTQNGICQLIVREGRSQSSCFFSPVPYENVQKPCHLLEFPWSKAGSQSLASHALNAQSTSDFVQACGAPTSTKGFPEDSMLFGQNCKKVGKKNLDLHLPACEYIDSDEEEYSMERNLDKASDVPYYSEKLSPVNNKLNSSLCKNVFGPGPSLRSSVGLADLNEPVNLEEQELAPHSYDSSRTEFESCISSKNYVLNVDSGQELEACTNTSFLKNNDGKWKCLASTNESGIGEEKSFLPSLSGSKADLKSWDGKMIKGVDISVLHAQNIATLVSATRQTAAQADVSGPSLSPPNSISKEFGCVLGQNSKLSEQVIVSKGLDLNAIPDGFLPHTLAFHGIKPIPQENKFDNMKSTGPWFKEKTFANGELIEGMSLSFPETKEINDSKEGVVSNISISAIPAYKSGKAVHSEENLLKSGVNEKQNNIEHAIDLNSYASEGDYALEDTELQAPVSPENKESSPPRGESDGNQFDLSYQLLEQEDTGLQKQEVRTAAEVLVSISICWIEKSLYTSASWAACQSPSSDSLYWFAAIIDRVEDDPDDSSNVVLADKVGDVEEFMHNEIDEYEAMTLELKETKVGDCFCIINDLKDEEAALTSSPCQSKKSRSRRGRPQKDFQREVLPSLASLSRYEATEDLQLIGGLIEAAGPRVEKTCLRSSSRTGLSRGRKRSASAIKNNNALGSMTGELTSSNNELSIEKRCLMGWENITRKRRGQRYSAKPTIEPST